MRKMLPDLQGRLAVDELAANCKEAMYSQLPSIGELARRAHALCQSCV